MAVVCAFSLHGVNVVGAVEVFVGGMAVSLVARYVGSRLGALGSRTIPGRETRKPRTESRKVESPQNRFAPPPADRVYSYTTYLVGISRPYFIGLFWLGRVGCQTGEFMSTATQTI